MAFAALLAGGLLAARAEAQINPFRSRNANTLTGPDIQLLIQASETLLARPTLAPGEAETWRNANTGSFGAITVRDTTRRQGMLCHALDYDSQASGAESQRTGTLTWCKTKQGWRIAS